MAYSIMQHTGGLGSLGRSLDEIERTNAIHAEEHYRIARGKPPRQWSSEHNCYLEKNGSGSTPLPVSRKTNPLLLLEE